ncbi:MAG TPA: HAD family phosphatase [Candidatus Dormibacteraeota bacterium]|nr:HAD family phosphatase [Candidatus Dormibacteraeota bacterium]
MPELKAVLFDMDGVLIDSEPVWERVRREFIERRGGQWSTELQKRMMGVSTAVWSEELSEQLAGSLSPSAVAGVVIAEMASSYQRFLPQIDGAAVVVRNLARHFRLGLASGSPRSLIVLALRIANLTDCFDVVLSTDEVNRGKPAPDPYEELARRLGLKPAECVAIEDSTNGLLSATAAGARVVAIPRGQHSPDAAALAAADAVLDDIYELTPELLLALPAASR